MSIRTSSLRYCVPLLLVAACSTDRVATPDSPSLSPRFSFTGPSVNGRVVFVSDRDHKIPQRLQVYSVNPDGTDLVRLTGYDVPGDVHVADYPAVSADGRKIAFAGYQPNGEGMDDIYTMNADGTGKTRLTNHPGIDLGAEWSPDRTKIAFTSERSGSWQLWVMDTLGTNLIQLTTGGSGGNASWSPDGTKLIYTGECGDPLAYGICQVSPDGNSAPVRLVTAGSGGMGWPNWSPNGQRIVFAGTYNGLRAIWLINPDGTNEHPLVTQEGGGTNPRWSPDGTKILFMRSFVMMVADAEGQNQNIGPFTTNDIGGNYNFNPYWGPAPPAPKQCSDGIDNDSDTKTDYPADPGCSSATDDDETDPPPPPICSDGTDNDSDGKIDYPADPGCTSATDNDETDPAPVYQCGDGVDNDTDGKIDYPADPGCSSATDNDETDPAPVYQCSDGLDNDGDGKIDYPADPGCSSLTDNQEKSGGGGGGPPPKPQPQCSDGLDNDGDGKIDFPADTQCRNAKDNDESR